MIATSLLSLVLLALAGALLDAHRRDWRHADTAEQDDDGRRFARSRYRRRRLASGLIAVLGVLVAVWPVVPREPTPVLVYLAALSSLALTLIGFAASDAWASGAYYGESAANATTRSAPAMAATSGVTTNEPLAASVRTVRSPSSRSKAWITAVAVARMRWASMLTTLCRAALSATGSAGSPGPTPPTGWC